MGGERERGVAKERDREREKELEGKRMMDGYCGEPVYIIITI